MLITFLIVFLIFTIILLFVITSAFLGFVVTRVPFVPTPEKDLEMLARKLKLSDKDIFYDLGSGNGRVCFAISKLTGARCVGFELTLWTHLWAKIKLKTRDLSLKSKQIPNIKFYRKDFFKEDWSKATVIYGYLYPPLMPRVKEKFLAECKAGTWAVTRDFFLPGLKPLQVIKTGGGHEIYIYEK